MRLLLSVGILAVLLISCKEEKDPNKREIGQISDKEKVEEKTSSAKYHERLQLDSPTESDTSKAQQVTVLDDKGKELVQEWHEHLDM